MLGVIGGTVEGYGSVGGIGDVGFRAMATSRMLATSVGADWDIRHGRVNTIVSWQSAIRRGGILGHGSMLRVDWIPERATDRTHRFYARRLSAARRTHASAPRRPSDSRSAATQRQRVAARDAATQRLAHDIESAST